jgi:anti-sigma factor RsiW
MKCVQARRLFGSYWDDETSQGEREWLESHMASCAACRREYETLARALEMTATLPRVEPSPDLVDRVLASSRRSTPAPDRLPTRGVQWIPVTAAAALLLIVGMVVSPWMGLGPGVQMTDDRPSQPVALEPSLSPSAATPVPSEPSADQPTLTGDQAPLAAIPDSLFDHSEDIEFVLDPVTVRRGRASLSSYPSGVQGEHAVITF